MKAYREHIEKMVRFEDHKKSVVRSTKSMEKAIDDRIRRINASKAIMAGLDDYDDRKTEY